MLSVAERHKYILDHLNKYGFVRITDATWDERLTVICLIAAIAGMGTMPLWISDMVSGSVSTIISQLMN